MAEQEESKICLSITSHLLNITKSVFYLTIAFTFLAVLYLLYSNPTLNYIEKVRIEEQHKQDSVQLTKVLSEWIYDMTSDVDIKEEYYPIVVLRTGFKAIKIENDYTLVGWKYEIMNTSSTTRYTVDVNFKLKDLDGFEITSDLGSGIVNPESYGVITDYIQISFSDIERLSGASWGAINWSINLSPKWESNEKTSIGKRYERLKEIVVENGPYWIMDSIMQYEFLSQLSPKWSAIKEAFDAHKKKE